jgi:hypothetical protein
MIVTYNFENSNAQFFVMGISLLMKIAHNRIFVLKRYQELYFNLMGIMMSFKLFLIGYKIILLPHISTFYYSVALLCSAKKLKSQTKILIFCFNQKSLKRLQLIKIKPNRGIKKRVG